MLKSLVIVLVFLVAFLSYAVLSEADMVADGLISYWSLDASTIDEKNVEDLVGENDGTLNGTKQVPGKIGEAREFNGTDDKIDIPGTDSLALDGMEEFSVSAWIYVEGPSGGICCGSIVAQRDVGAWALRYDNRNVGAEVEFIVQPGWVGDGGDFGLSVPQNEWHHVTGVLTGDKLLLYLDGEVGSEAAFGAGAVASDGTATTIGGASDGYFNGIIDEVLIYGRALTDAEVMQNFKAKRFAAVDPEGKLTTLWGQIKSL